MTTPTAKLRVRERVIVALLSARTIKDAAVQSGVAERSIQRWLKESEFQEEYRNAKSELLEGSINQLRTAGFDAAQRLHKIILDPAAPATAVVAASTRLLDLLLKSVEIQDLVQRLDRLEVATLKDGDNR
jgi:hypothetical protein